MTRSLEDCEARYGKIVDGVWPNQEEWLETIGVPEEIQWTNNGKLVRHVYCNKDMTEPLLAAFHEIVDGGLESELKTFDGCFNIRMVRGTSDSLSCHSYGLAIDINADSNALGETPTLSPELVACFTAQGFSWGGNFHHRKDGMHFSFGWE